MQKKLLIFDLDGTIIDSAQDIVETLNKVAVSVGETVISANIIKSYIGEGLLQLMKDLFPHRTDWPDLILKFRKIYIEEGLRHTTIYPGAVDFLRSWKGDLALVTNKSEGPTHHVLKQLGLDQIPWKSIIGGDTLAERKPHPLPLLVTLERLQRQAKEAVMIGDAYPDLKAALEANIDSVAVTFGYSKIESLHQYKPKAFLHSYKQLDSVIASLKD